MHRPPRAVRGGGRQGAGGGREAARLAGPVPTPVSRKVLSLSLLSALALGGGLTAFFRSRGPARPPGAAEVLYAESCASCHGPELAGGMGPSLVDAEWRHGGDD